MAQTVRPLSPHMSVYRWQVQMLTSILHRATGIALAVGFLIIVWGLCALAASESAWATFTSFAGSFIGILLLIGWSWALFYHFCNGIRHLIQDAGVGYHITHRAAHNVNEGTFVRSSKLSIIGSVVLTVIAWILVGVLV